MFSRLGRHEARGPKPIIVSSVQARVPQGPNGRGGGAHCVRPEYNGCSYLDLVRMDSIFLGERDRENQTGRESQRQR